MKSIISISLDSDLVERIQLEGIVNVSQFVGELINEALSEGGYKKRKLMKEINQKIEELNANYGVNLCLRAEEGKLC